VKKFWLPLNDNTDLQKHMQIFDANLRPFCCRRFCGKTDTLKDDVHRHAVDTFHESLKRRINFRHDLTSPVSRPEYNRKCMPCNYAEATCTY